MDCLVTTVELKVSSASSKLVVLINVVVVKLDVNVDGAKKKYGKVTNSDWREIA